MISAMQQDKVIAICYRDFPPGSVITNVELTGSKTKIIIREDTKFFFTAMNGTTCFARIGLYYYSVWTQGKGFAKILNSEENIIRKSKINKKLLLLTR